jgi:uncharacterized surface protein with fasciclin (FAS1) repeats
MRISRRVAGAAVGAALALGATTAVAAPANAAPAAPVQSATPKLGTKSLVAVLTADKSGFDRNGADFDILTAAVKAVLGAKPKSAVGVLANGKVPVTAFIPNDLAFRYLVRDLTGKNARTEADAFKAVASLGIPTVEKVLLYHVVPGKTIDSKAASKANNVRLHTAAGLSVKVRVVGKTIFLQDRDPDARNPRVIAADVNKGNRQIAHVIDRVLRPVNL